MIKYNITVHETVCPNCFEHLRYQGNKSFGAPEALCGGCGKKMETGLTEWANLTGSGKRSAALKEMLLPSFFTIQGVQRIVVGFFFQLVFVSITFGTYAFWLAWRLRKLIAESNAYTTSGVLPVIKIGNALRA